MHVLAFVVGAICSLLISIGGAELFDPLMLMCGVIPQGSSATTSMNSLLNSLSFVVVDSYVDDFDAASVVPLTVLGSCFR